MSNFAFLTSLLLIGVVALDYFLRRRLEVKRASAKLGATSATHETEIIKPEDQHVTIQRLLIYPIKSCLPIAVQSAAYSPEGLEFDRKWMVVDLELNKQLSARDGRGLPLMRIQPRIERDSSAPDGGKIVLIFLGSPETPSIKIPLCPTEEDLAEWELLEGFDLWGSAPSGYIVPSSDDTGNEEPSAILTAWTGHRVALVMKSTKARECEFPPLAPPREVQPLGYGAPRVSFADFTPFLLISTASLRDAEEHIHAAAEDGSVWKSKTLAVERFRPNIVVEGVQEAFGEDDWVEAEIHGKPFHFPVRCLRCMFPNVDPDTGVRDAVEPNRTLMQYRRVEALLPGKYCMGMLALPIEASGVLYVGDRVKVVKSEHNPRLGEDDMRTSKACIDKSV